MLHWLRPLSRCPVCWWLEAKAWRREQEWGRAVGHLQPPTPSGLKTQLVPCGNTRIDGKWCSSASQQEQKARKQRACWLAKATGIPLDTPLDVVNTENEIKLHASSTTYIFAASGTCGCHARLCPCSLGAVVSAPQGGRDTSVGMRTTWIRCEEFQVRPGSGLGWVIALGNGVKC